jgi:hypothetical protein
MEMDAEMKIEANRENNIYMMYVNMEEELHNTMCIVFGYTSLNSMSRVVLDRRSMYVKFKNQRRYYKDYMEVFKYTDPGDTLHYNPRLNVYIKLMEKVTDEKKLNDTMNLMIIKYKLRYGDAVVNNVNNSIIDRVILKEPVILVPKPEPAPELTSAEKRKLSRKKYEDSIREKLRQKSKDYYAANKEILREKRLAKEAAAAEN